MAGGGPDCCTRLSHPGAYLRIKSAPCLGLPTAWLGVLDPQTNLGRLVQLGLSVNEVKLRRAMSVEAEGELILSRNIRELAAAQQASAIVTGTYAAGGRNIYVNLKVLTPDERVLNSVDNIMPVDADTRRLPHTASLRS